MGGNDITRFIPEGKKNAITRERLCEKTGLPDRKNRELIEQARRRGAIIVNTQNGAGYYQTKELADVMRQYQQNERRALSILAQQKHLRRILKNAGVLQGKKVVLNDNV